MKPIHVTGACSRPCASFIAALFVLALAACGGGGGGSSDPYRPDTGGGSYTYFRGLDAADGSLLIHDARPTRDGGAILTGERVKESGSSAVGSRADSLATHSLAVVRVAADGNRIWAREIGGGSAAGYVFGAFADAAQASDGGYLLAGWGLRGGSLAKLSSDRRVVWQRHFPSGDFHRRVHRILPSADGGAVLVGTVSTHYYPGNNSSSSRSWLWLARVDANGAIQQERLDLEDLYDPSGVKRHGAVAYVFGTHYIAEFDALDLSRPIHRIAVEHTESASVGGTVDALAFDRTARSQAQGYFLAGGEPLAGGGAYDYGSRRSTAFALTRVTGDTRWREPTPFEERVIYRAFAPDPDGERILAAIERGRGNEHIPSLRRFERIDEDTFSLTDLALPAPPAGMPAAERLLGLSALPSGDHVLYGGTPGANGEQMLWVGMMERQTGRMLWTNRIDVRLYMDDGTPTWWHDPHSLVSPARLTDDDGDGQADDGLLLTFSRNVYKLDRSGNLEFTLPAINEYGESGASVVETSEGEFFIAAGGRRAAATGEPAGASLLRLRSDGSMRWRRLLPDYALTRALAPLENDEVGVLALDAGQGLVVLKLDATGSIVWRSNAIRSGCTQCFKGLLATRDGGFLAYSSGHLIKFSASGAEQWSQQTPADIAVDAVVQRPDGDYLLSGQRLIRLSFDGEEDSADQVPYPMLALLASDGSVVPWLRTYWIDKHRAHSVSVVPSIEGGATLVTTRLVDAEGEGARCILLPSELDERYGRSAHLQGVRACSDIVLLRVDERGDVIWQRSYGTASTDFAVGAITAADNGLLVWGRTDAFGYPYIGTALLRTDADGNVASIVTGADGRPISACPVSLGARLSSPAYGDTGLLLSPDETRSSEVAYAQFAESQDVLTGELELIQARACLAQNQAPVLRFTIEGQGTVTSAPAGIDCGPDCEQAYPTGTTVLLTATPSADNSFEGWAGRCAFLGTQNPASLQLFSDHDCTARFTGAGSGPGTPPPTGQTYELLVSADGAADRVRLTGVGIDCGPDCTERFAPGVAVRIVATVDDGHQVDTWVGCDAYSRNECTVIMLNGRSVMALVSEEIPDRVQLHVARIGAGSGDIQGLRCQSDYGCSEVFERGAQVTITAVANEGSVFHGWTGCPTPGALGTCTITMDESKFLTARFALPGQARLTVLRTGANAGAVHVISDRPGIDCGVDCIEDYPDYTLVRLTPSGVAVPPAEWRDCDFVHPDGSCEIELMTDRVVEIAVP